MNEDFRPNGPLDELRSVSLPREPLAASEIRRLGDRRRRTRRTAIGAGIAGVAAVALMSPFLASGDRLGTQSEPPVVNQPSQGADAKPGPTKKSSSSPKPRELDTPAPGTPLPAPGTPLPAPAPAVVTEVPAGFPLTANFPDPSQAENPETALRGPTRERVEQDLTACGPRSAAPPAQPVDVVQAKYADIEDVRFRQILTFANADEAISWVQTLASNYSSCVDTDADGDGSIRTYAVASTALGGQSYRVMIGAEQNGQPSFPLEVVEVVRFGSAVLYDSDYGESFASPKVLNAESSLQTRALEPVISAMCLFSAQGC